MKLKVYKLGQGEQCLVFFHGWGFDSQIWQDFIKHFLSTHRIILVDLPGFGESSLMTYEQFKEALLPYLPEQSVLLGWSLGGLYALRLAADLPQRVTHFISLCSTPYFLEDTSWSGVNSGLFERFMLRLSQDPADALASFMHLQGVKHSDKNKSLPSQKALEEGLICLSTWDLRSKLLELNLPILFIFGRLDPIVTVGMQRAVEALSEKIQTKYLRRSGHLPFVSEEHRVFELISEFIS